MKVSRPVWRCPPVVAWLGSAWAWSTPERRAGSWGWKPCRAACPLRASTSRPSGGGHAPFRLLLGRRLRLPAGHQLTVGDLGLLGERPLASADLLEGIGGRGALAPAPRRHAGAQ